MSLLDDIRKLISRYDRRIKDVDSWDGSPSRWESTAAYCQACLIDVNLAAGRDEKAQSHCMLPVREPGDSSDTYVRQAVHAATGGRGITAVKRPSDVDAEDWERALKNAARQLQDAYNQMDEDLPESVEEILERNLERAVAMNMIYETVWGALVDWDAPVEEMLWPVDIYLEEGEQPFVIAAREGHLFKVPIQIDGSDNVAFGEPIQVKQQFNEVRTFVHRQDDGRVRVTAVAAAAVMNRVAEIDSTVLFDSFIEHATSTGEYPIINFAHQGKESRLGQVDFLARDKYLYVVSYLFDDNEYGRAAGENFLADPDYWGYSIEFWADPDSIEVFEIIDGVKLRVFTKGVNNAISILAESKAASLFTGQNIGRGVTRMDENTLKDLRLLLGDDLAEQFAGRVDEANEDIESRDLVRRTAEAIAVEATDEEEAEEPAVDEQETDESETETEEEDAPASDEFVLFELDEEAMRDVSAAVVDNEAFADAIAQAVTNGLTAIQQSITDLTNRVNESGQAQVAANQDLMRRVEALEQPVQRQRNDFIADLPAQQRRVMITRPSQPEPTTVGRSNGAPVAGDPDVLADWDD